MLKFLSGLSLQQWIIVGLVSALGGAAFTIYLQQSTIDDQFDEMVELAVDIDKWKAAAESLEKLTRQQNKGIQDLADAKQLAEQRAAAADKKAAITLNARQKQKNAAEAYSAQVGTAEDAIARIKEELEGSLL